MSLHRDRDKQMRNKIMGYMTSQVIFSICELGIPDLLAAGPLSLGVLSQRTATNQDALGRFLRVLAREDIVVEVSPDVFSLSQLGELLLPGTVGSLSHLVELMAGEAYDVWRAASYSVRTGKPAFDHLHGMPYFSWLATHPDAAERFDRAQGGLAGLRMMPLLDLDWSGVGWVVDIGGGNGRLMAGLLSRYSELKGVVFDLSHVLPSAKAVLEDAGVIDRVCLEAGDFFTSVPEGADVYVLSKILHDWDDDQSETILRCCRKAIPSSGRLLLVEEVLEPGTGPDPRALLDVHMLVVLGGRERTAAQWRELLKRGGFALERVVTGPRSAVIEAAPC